MSYNHAIYFAKRAERWRLVAQHCHHIGATERHAVAEARCSACAREAAHWLCQHDTYSKAAQWLREYEAVQ